MRSEILRKARKIIGDLGNPLQIVEPLDDLWHHCDMLEETVQLIRKSTSDMDTRTLCERALGYEYPNEVEPTPDPRQMDLFNGT